MSGFWTQQQFAWKIVLKRAKRNVQGEDGVKNFQISNVYNEQLLHIVGKTRKKQESKNFFKKQTKIFASLIRIILAFRANPIQHRVSEKALQDDIEKVKKCKRSF